MLVNDNEKQLLIVPMKCGSSSYRTLYANNPQWTDFSKVQHLDDLPLSGTAKIYKIFKLTNRNINEYSTTLIVRDPVQWLVSGYRFLRLMYNPRAPWYPKSLSSHLKKVYRDDRSDLFFSDHCSVMPDQYYIKGCNVQRLEQLNLPVKENTTPDKIPYPKLDEKSIELITKITKNYCQLFNYSIEKSIKYYNKEIP